MRHGWFKIPGLQDGDRSAEEQLLGLEVALANCRGKTVLDLGAAEGVISAAFAFSGASHVLAVEMVPEHCAAARIVCAGKPVTVVQAELRGYIEENPEPIQFDIVLALGIAHKLHDPASLLSFAARACKDTLIFRGPGKEKFWDGWLRAKFGQGACHVPTLLAEHGFVEGKTFESARSERAQYWHRNAVQQQPPE